MKKELQQLFIDMDYDTFYLTTSHLTNIDLKHLLVVLKSHPKARQRNPTFCELLSRKIREIENKLYTTPTKVKQETSVPQQPSKLTRSQNTTGRGRRLIF